MKGKIFGGAVRFLFSLAIIVLLPKSAAADVWHVDFTRTFHGTGTAWGDEFARLQKAVDASADGDEIWVKDVNPNPRPDGFDYYNIVSNLTAVAKIDKAIGIYGGFTGTETERSQRDWVNNEIIISGGGIVPHIFEISASVTIDGFTIRDSHAYNFLPADNPNNYGGGFYIKSPAGEHIQVIVRNCRMTNHQADWGGAMYIEEASVTVENCTIDNNTADFYPAGISYNVSDLANAAFTLRGSTVNNNRSFGGGAGGLELLGGFSNPGVVIAVEDSIIDGNISPQNGGGLYGYAQGSGSMLTISNARVTGNSAAGNGGGMYIFSNAKVVNTLVEGNSAGFDGGGISLSGNVALQNVTVVNNSATIAAGITKGGGISFLAGGTADNTIVWGNTSAGGFDNATSLTAFSHSSVDISDISDGAELAAFNDALKKNTSTAPTFVNAAGGDYRLVSGSAGIDAGDNAAANGLDLDAKPRFLDDPATVDGGSGTAPIVDMGAYEFGTAPADYDGDGIDSDVDGYFTGAVVVNESAVSSDNFTDRSGGGATDGTLTDRADLDLTVLDSTLPADGVDVAAGGAGVGTATVTACGFTLEFSNGDAAILTCGSLTADVTTGPVLVHVTGDITVDIPSGTTAVITETASGFDVACSGAGPLTVQHPGGPSTLNDGESTVYVSALAEMTMAVAPLGGGTTTPTGTSVVTKGADQPITAGVAAGYRFDGWSAFPAGNAAFGNSAEASTNVTLSGDATVRANFVEQVSLTMAENPDEGGNTTPSPGATLVDMGVAQAISTTVTAGYLFTGWTAVPAADAVFGNAAATTTNVTLGGDATVTANYGLAVTLTVAVVGDGTVTSSPAGIDCGGDCAEIYASGTSVTLTPAAGTGSTFTGWTGDAACAGGVVAMTADASCTATFTLDQHTLTVTKAGSGTGTVTSTPVGIDCGGDCAEIYDYGTAVTLTPVAGTGSTFTGWSGDADCSDGIVAMTADASCIAAFTLDQHALTVSRAGAGTGTVTSAPAGINCGDDCSESYDYDTSVTLTPVANTGSVFAGWSGDADCTDGMATMTADVSCTATFDLETSPSVAGDWDGDGNPDMVWRDPVSGNNVILYLDGAARKGLGFIQNAPPPWEMKAAADFNGDGWNDLVWRNSTLGANIVAYFENRTFLGIDRLPGKSSPWKVSGSADFNDDGSPDLVLGNPDTGENEVWYLDGPNQFGTDTLPKVPPPWVVVAIDDLDGDGMPDLLARNGDTGLLAAGYLDGVSLKGIGILPKVPLSMEVCGTMDVNGDGSPDILLRDPVSGRNEVWYMDGRKSSGKESLPSAPPPWYGLTGYK